MQVKTSLIYEKLTYRKFDPWEFRVRVRCNTATTILSAITAVSFWTGTVVTPRHIYANLFTRIGVWICTFINIWRTKQRTYSHINPDASAPKSVAGGGYMI